MKTALPEVGRIAERLGRIGADEDGAGIVDLATQASASASESSRCSGAMRLAMAQASSRSRTSMSAPRFSSGRESLPARHGRQQFID